jgi:hypothetical protein
MHTQRVFKNSIKILFTIFLLFLVFQSVDLSKISLNLRTLKLESLILILAGVPRDQGLVISLAISALLVVCNLGGLLFLPGIPKRVREMA